MSVPAAAVLATVAGGAAAPETDLESSIRRRSGASCRKLVVVDMTLRELQWRQTGDKSFSQTTTNRPAGKTDSPVDTRTRDRAGRALA